MTKLSMLIFFITSALLCGCQSEVDKCVEANMNGYDAKKKPYDERPRAEVEGLTRLVCLEAANKR